VILLLWSWSFAADPAALRQLGERRAAVDLGTHGVGTAVPLTDTMGVSVQHGYGSYLSAHVGGLRAVGERPWGVDLGWTLGAAVLTATPGAALLASGELRAGRRDDAGEATLGLVVPLALGGWPPSAAVPLGMEARLAARLGPLWLGLRGQAGATLWTSGAPAARAEAAAFVGWGAR
jgi:hypothetical protein